MVACSILAQRAGLPCTAGEFDRSFFKGRCCCVTISFFSTSFGWVETINFFFSGISVSQIQVGQGPEPFSCLGAETRAEARNFFHGDMAAAPKQNHFKGTGIKQNVVNSEFFEFYFSKRDILRFKNWYTFTLTVDQRMYFSKADAYMDGPANLSPATPTF